MIEVSEDDWELYTYECWTTLLSEEVSASIDGYYIAPQYECIVDLYRIYRLGYWKNKIPDPDSLEDVELLYTPSEGLEITFHKYHEKFGRHIVEYSNMYCEHKFVFFDYASLEPVFTALNEGCKVPIPYVPVYHALTSDRTDYKEGDYRR